MFTWGSRNLLFIALFAYLGAIVHGLSTGGSIVGTLSLGYKGGVGEHIGFTILIGASLVALVLAVVSIATREGNAEDMAAAVGADRALAVRPPTQPTFWGPLAAFGLACMAVGAAVSQAFFILGIVIIAITTLEWTALAWSDRATGDADVNSVIRSRMLSPFEVPVLALLGIAIVVLGLSRVLLTVSEAGSVVVAVVAAAFVFAVAVAAAKLKLSRAVVSALVAFGAVAVLAGGIIGAVNGERDFHHGEDGEHSDEGAMIDEDAG